MPFRPAATAACVCLALLAGCADDGGGGGAGNGDQPPAPGSDIQAGKGAISGLLIDDRFRPLAGGLVLLQPIGLTATSNADGEFVFIDIDPGTYTARATIEGHEAAPEQVTVEVGVWAELNLDARRIFNEQGQVVTQEFSVFIPCAADFVVNGVVANCFLDLSGDTYRAGFTVNYNETENITYLVTEMKANQVASYTVQVREDDGSAAGGERYAVGRIVDDDYIKMVNQLGVANTEHNQQMNNVPWNNTLPFMTIVFMEGDYKDEIQGAADNACSEEIDDATPPAPANINTCRDWRGLGARVGITAKFVQSLFIGEPVVDIATYHVLEP